MIGVIIINSIIKPHDFYAKLNIQLGLNIEWVLAEINDLIQCTNALVDIKMFPLIAVK